MTLLKVVYLRSKFLDYLYLAIHPKRSKFILSKRGRYLGFILGILRMIVYLFIGNKKINMKNCFRKEKIEKLGI